MKENLTAKAIELMRQNPGMTVYAAAKQIGITPTTLYAGIKRAESRVGMCVCPCCGSKVRADKIKPPDF